MQRYGCLDILVNNVGITLPGTVVDVTEEVWDQVLDVILKSMMLTSKYSVPRMQEGGGGSDRQHLVDTCHSLGGRFRQCSVHRIQGRGRLSDDLAGLQLWCGQHQGQRHIAWIYLHAHGRGKSDRGGPGPEAAYSPSRHGGDRLGCRLGRGLPGQRRVPMGDRHSPASGRGRDDHHPSDHARPVEVAWDLGISPVARSPRSKRPSPSSLPCPQGYTAPRGTLKGVCVDHHSHKPPLPR